MSLLAAFAPSRAHEVLAGDDLLPHARAEVTHRVDLRAPASAVWPWLVQMGRRRGGWYSWDLLDNGGVRSAERILPEFQAIAVGDVLPIKASGPEGFTVLAVQPLRALVLGNASLLPSAGNASSAPRATWAFSLEPLGESSTRLSVRVRVEYEPSFATACLRPLIEALHELMVRKQLRTLKQRVEGQPRSMSALSQSSREREPSLLARLVGSGHRIALFALPFGLVAAALSVWKTGLFRIGDLPRTAQLLAAIVLVLGLVIWAWSVALILIKVPRRELITNGPYAWLTHPLYTSVALLVLPAAGVLLHSWLGVVLGIALYVGSRLFSGEEERSLEKTFGAAWHAYVKSVKIPWL